MRLFSKIHDPFGSFCTYSDLYFMMKYVLGLKEMPLFDFTKEDNCNEDLCLKITFNCGNFQSSVQVNFQKVKDEVENEIMECSLEGTFSHDPEKIAVLSYFDCDKKDIGTDVMEVCTNRFSI